MREQRNELQDLPRLCRGEHVRKATFTAKKGNFRNTTICILSVAPHKSGGTSNSVRMGNASLADYLM